MAKDDPKADANASSAKKASVPWLPVLLAFLVIPVLTLALTEFVIVPRLASAIEESLGLADDAEARPARTGRAAQPPPVQEFSMEFNEIVANLSGTMGTRVMRVSFQVTSRDPNLREIMNSRRARVQDAIITTLSASTIQQLEVPGGRNGLRVRLISAINQAVGAEVVQDLFFTEFIIQ